MNGNEIKKQVKQFEAEELALMRKLTETRNKKYAIQEQCQHENQFETCCEFCGLEI